MHVVFVDGSGGALAAVHLTAAMLVASQRGPDRLDPDGIVHWHWRLHDVSRALPIVVASISLIALHVGPAAWADVSVRGDSGLNSKVNGQRDGSCKAGVCRISGGRRGGRKKQILFHRLSELDTRGDRIKKIKLNVGARKTKSVIVGVTNRKGSYLTSPFVLSGKADLILLSPGGLQVNGATFKNINHLSLAATSQFKMGDGVFDVFNTSSDQLSSFSLADETSLRERADDFLIDLSSTSINDDHGQSVQGSIRISDQLTVDSDLLVVAKQPIKVKRAQLDVAGDLHLESRLSNDSDFTDRGDIPEKKQRQNMILLSNIDANVSGDVVVSSESGLSDRSYGGLLVRGSELSVDGQLMASTQASSQSRFNDSHGIVLRKGTTVHAESIDLTGIGGNSSRRDGNEGIWVVNSELFSEQDLTITGLGGDGRKLVDGVVLQDSNLHSENGRLMIEGQGGNHAEISMDGIQLLDDVSLSAASEVSLHGKAGLSRSPNQGAGIFARSDKKQRASIDADRVQMVGVGAKRELDSAWPKEVNENVTRTRGIDIKNFDMHASGAVKIKGKGGFGNEDLEGVALKNVNIQSEGAVELKGFSGYSDKMDESAGVYLDQLNLSAKNAIIIGRHPSDKDAPSGKFLNGITIADSNIDVQNNFSAFGLPSKGGKVKNTAGVNVKDSNVIAKSMRIYGVPGEFTQYHQGNITDKSLIDILDESNGVNGNNIGLWLNNSNFFTRDGDLVVIGVGAFGEKAGHGVWLDQSTKLTAKNGNLEIIGVAGFGASEMHGVLIQGSHLLTDMDINVLGDSNLSETGMNNVGIKFVDHSSLSAGNITLNGAGGIVEQGGKILDGVSMEETQLTANNKLIILGYAGYGSNISRSNGISLNQGSDLTAGSVVLRGYGTKKQQFTGQPTDQMVVTDQSNKESKNHGVSIKSASIQSENDMQIKGFAGRGQELLDGVHIDKSHLVADDGMTIRGEGSVDANGTFKFSDGVYSSNSILESNGLIKLIGKGAAGQKLEKNFGVELSGMKILGSDVRIKGQGGIASRKSVLSSGVLISNYTDIQAKNSVKIKGSSGSDVSNVRISDGAAVVSSSLKSKTLNIEGIGVDGGDNIKKSSGVYFENSLFDVVESISIHGVSGHGNDLKRSNGVDLVSTQLFSETIKVSGVPFSTRLSDFSGFLNQGINIKRSSLTASKDVLLQGVGGFGVALLDGINVQNSQLISGQSLSMVGQGGKGENISSSTGMIIRKQSAIHAPQLTMEGKGGSSLITEDRDQYGTYLNDGIAVVDSTIRSVQADLAVSSSQPESKLVIDGEGGEIIGDSFSRGDLNSGVVFWDATLRADGPSTITGLAGKPPKGNTNTGVEIGANSKLKFVSDFNNVDTEVFIQGKAYAGKSKNTAVKITDSELHSSYDVTIVGDGAPNSTGKLNQGVRFENGLVRVGDASSASLSIAGTVQPFWLTAVDHPVDSARNLTIKGLGGKGRQGNSGISMKNTEAIVSGTILLEGEIREQEWLNNPSVFLNGSFLSAGEDLFVEADYDVKVTASELDAGRDILIRSNTLQLFDSSLNALRELSLQSADITTDATNVVGGSSDETTDSDSANQADADVTTAINTVLSTRTLSLDEIEQLVLNQEQSSMDRLSKNLGLDRAQPMGLRDIQNMLQRSIQKQRN